MPLILHTRNIAYNGDTVRVMPSQIVAYMATYKDGYNMTLILLTDGSKLHVTETPDEIDQKF